VRSLLFGGAGDGRERRAFAFVSPPIPPNSEAGLGFARVDLSRTEASLQKIAIWACVNLIATITETMPLDVYSGDGANRKPIPMPGWLADLGGDGHGLQDWLWQWIYSAMLRGNVYGLVGARDRRTGQPTQIVLQHPDEVHASRQFRNGPVDWRINGQQVDDPNTVWHRRVHPVPGRLLGLSPIQQHALTIGVGIAALHFGAQWFEEGAHPSGILSSEQDLNQTKADTAKQRFLAALRGKREPVVLGSGWKFQPIQIAPNESQFLETNNYTGAECCRIFGPGLAEVFGYGTGDSLTYKSVEQRSLDLLTYAADPWLVRVERVLSGLLPPPSYVKFDRKALVRTDLLTRYKAYEVALRNQWMVVNEVREDEDQAPVEWGATPNAAGPAPPADQPPIDQLPEGEA
jgi:HK97 family phage portal protein